MLRTIGTVSVTEELEVVLAHLSPYAGQASSHGVSVIYRSLNLNLIIELLVFSFLSRPHNRAAQALGPPDLVFNVGRDRIHDGISLTLQVAI